jgi:pSer/pThr/pTyr-binding forkhead associated (FHA) protein
MEASWDVCPYCAETKEDLARTRVHPEDRTTILGKSSPPAGWLVALTGSQRGQTFPLGDGKNDVGKDANCAVRLSDEGISDLHARILRSAEDGDGRWVVVDQDSTNGTFLNDGQARIDREEIIDNDVVRFGNTDLIFKSLPKGAIHRLRS